MPRPSHRPVPHRRPRHLPGRLAPPPPPTGPTLPRGRRHLWPASIVLALVAVAYGGWRLYNSPWLQISDVKIQGAVAESEDAIRQAAAVDGARFFEVDTATVAARIEKLPRIELASVHRRFPHGVTIAVQERAAAGIWRVGAISYTVGDDGTVLDADGDRGGLPVIDASRASDGIQLGERVDPDPVRAAAHVLVTVPQPMARGIVRFEYDHVNGLSVITDSGAVVYLGDGKDLDYKLAVWQGLLAKVNRSDLHEIDLRYGDRPFYR